MSRTQNSCDLPEIRVNEFHFNIASIELRDENREQYSEYYLNNT